MLCGDYGDTWWMFGIDFSLWGYFGEPHISVSLAVRSPQQGPGAEPLVRGSAGHGAKPPWSWEHFSILMSNERGKIYRSDSIWPTALCVFMNRIQWRSQDFVLCGRLKTLKKLECFFIRNIRHREAPQLGDIEGPSTSSDDLGRL